MSDLKELIEQEIDQYLEWPTADKSHVTTVSAKLFAEHAARLYADHIAEARKKVSRPQIRGVFMRNGAKIEPDRDDLPDWVYESVFELLDSAIQQAGPAIQYVAPAVQGEPVAYISHTSEGDILGWERQFDAPNHTTLYTTPQPTEHHPECGCCGQTDRCDDDCDAVVIGGHGAAEQKPTTCVGCEGAPVSENSPCAVCGQKSALDVPGLAEALEARRDDLRWMSLRHNYHNQTVEEADAAFPAQQSAPDITQLVKAMEMSVNYLNQSDDERIHSGSIAHNKMRDALAAYRKGGDI